MADSPSDNVAARPAVLVLGLLAIVTVSVWARTLSAGFVWDDVWLFPGRPDFWRLSNLGTMLTQMDNVFTGNPNGFYRPLATVTFLIDAMVWGLNPIGFHLTNLAWHLATVWMVYAIGRHLDLSVSGAAAAAVLFAVHPVTVESVAWINGRNNVLAGFFYSAAAVGYLRWRRGGTRAMWGLSAAAMFLSLMAKEYAVTFPILVAVIEWLFSTDETHRRRRLWAGIWRALAFGPVLLAYGLLRWAVLPAGAAAVDARASGLWQRLMDVPGYLTAYIQLLTWPRHLTVFHAAPHFPAVLPWGVVAVMGIAIWATITDSRRSAAVRTIALGIIWFAVALLPVVQIIPIPFVDTPMSDRYAYIPAMAGCLAVAAAARTVRGRFRVVAMGVIFAMAIFLGIRTMAQISVWHSDLSLWRYETRVNPTSFKAWTNLAMAHVRQGEDGPAADAARAAIRLQPDHPMPHFILARLLEARGDRTGALAEYARTVALDPGHATARERLAALTGSDDSTP